MPFLTLPFAAVAVGFAVLFWLPLSTLALDWWNDPEAGHGLLLFPVSLWLMWRRGMHPAARPEPLAGAALLIAAILLRYASGLAAEPFTMRLSVLIAFSALTLFYFGRRQVLHMGLPLTLMVLCIPLPAMILNTLAMPLQLQASRMGAALLEWRHVPVYLAGNAIHLPGRSLFVTEACSGLRSLTSLIALGVLIAGLWLRLPLTRVVLVVVAIPIAILLNSLRVFLTGFLVFFVHPDLGEGFMHLTEGWLMFLLAFALLGATAWVLSHLESGRQAEHA